MELVYLSKEEEVQKWIREELSSVLSKLSAPKVNKAFAEEPLLSRTEIQSIFGISKTTIYNWEKDGPPHYRKKRRIYFRSEVLKYLQKNKKVNTF